MEISSDSVTVKALWSLTKDDEKNWRPGGMIPAVADSSGLGYFLMHPDGKEGSHKDGGSEVWVYDLTKGQRLSRMVLRNWGISLGTSGSGNNRLMLVTNAEMGVDVYRIPKGEYGQSLKVEVATPFFIHGAH